jgi:hypothetical protein
MFCSEKLTRRPGIDETVTVEEEESDADRRAADDEREDKEDDDVVFCDRGGGVEANN